MKTPRPQLTAADEEEILRLKSLGLSDSAVARKIDRSKSTVHVRVRILRKGGQLPAIVRAEKKAVERRARPKPIKLKPVKPIPIGSFEQPLGVDERERDFLDALAASERHPAQARVREGRAVAPRLSAPLSVSCVGSPSLTCSEN